MSKTDEFHAHLDKCKRCREGPFNPCAIGKALLIAAATEMERKPKQSTSGGPTHG